MSRRIKARRDAEHANFDRSVEPTFRASPHDTPGRGAKLLRRWPADDAARRGAAWHRLDHLGSVVNAEGRLERLSSGEDVVIFDAVSHDSEAAQLLSAPDKRLVVERFESRPRGFDEEQFYLWRVELSSHSGVGAV